MRMLYLCLLPDVSPLTYFRRKENWCRLCRPTFSSTLTYGAGRWNSPQTSREDELLVDVTLESLVCSVNM